VESEEGHGSTFWFTARFQKQTIIPSVPLPAPIKFENLRVLAVDDNPTNRLIMTKMLEHTGFRVSTARNGEEALQALQEAQRVPDPFDLVLLDLQMPDLDGEQTLTAIKADPLISKVSVIIMTSMGRRGDAARLEAIGCSGYIIKPIRQSQLFDIIMTVMERRNWPQLPDKSNLVTRHTISEEKQKEVRVLLAEDNLVNQKLAMAILRKLGYPADVVDNGSLVLEALKKRPYNLILMDVQMPEMDGYETTQAIRQIEPSGEHIPIIAMTAHAMKGDEEKCLEAGMDDYLSKPINQKAVKEKLERWLSTGEQAPEGASEQFIPQIGRDGKRDILRSGPD